MSKKGTGRPSPGVPKTGHPGNGWDSWGVGTNGEGGACSRRSAGLYLVMPLKPDGFFWVKGGGRPATNEKIFGKEKTRPRG